MSRRKICDAVKSTSWMSVSALLTTTMPKMKATIEALKEACATESK
jgi:methanogenic corrinoid protein MtbC1